MNRALPVAALLSLLGPGVLAQTASFQAFGRGCRSSLHPWCAGNNVTASQMAPFVLIAYPQHAIEADAGNPVVVQSFELFTRNAAGQVNVPAYVFLPDASGAPQLTPAATGSITVGTTAAWYAATFTQPIVVPGGRFFLSWLQNPTGKAFADAFANSGTTSRSWSRPGNTGSWTGPTNYPWAFRITCIGIKGMAPTLTNTGLPKLGQSYSLVLAGALANAPTLLVTGFSNQMWGPFKLPLDLAGAGAAGCSLLVAFDLVAGTATSSSGGATVAIALPNDARLAGLQLHSQYATVDAPANQLGLVLSNGGTATLGN